MNPDSKIPRYVFKWDSEAAWWLVTTFGVPVIVLVLTSLVGTSFERFSIDDWRTWALSALAASVRAVVAIALSLLRSWFTGEQLIQKS